MMEGTCKAKMYVSCFSLQLVGDCCLPDIKTDYCQQCACLEAGTGMTYGTGSTLPPGTDGTTSLCHNDRFVADGYCDDSTNTELCNYDGGDCCYKKSNYQYCNDCTCYPGSPEIKGIAKRNSFLFFHLTQSHSL